MRIAAAVRTAVRGVEVLGSVNSRVRRKSLHAGRRTESDEGRGNRKMAASSVQRANSLTSSSPKTVDMRKSLRRQDKSARHGLTCFTPCLTVLAGFGGRVLAPVPFRCSRSPREGDARGVWAAWAYLSGVPDAGGGVGWEGRGGGCFKCFRRPLLVF